MPEIKLKKKLIYAGDAHRAILEADPKLAYCIERIKAVDAEEVVHCKDCRWKFQNNGFSREGCVLRNYVKDDDFCSYGERENDGNQ